MGVTLRGKLFIIGWLKAVILGTFRDSLPCSGTRRQQSKIPIDLIWVIHLGQLIWEKNRGTEED